MASMTILLPDPLSRFVQERIDSGRYASVDDYVRELIRRDRDGSADAARWLRDLDDSIAESVAERDAGGGHDLEMVCDAVLADLASTGDRPRP